MATVAEVIAHLTAVDGLVAVALGLTDPLDTADGRAGAAGSAGPHRGVLAALRRARRPRRLRDVWRDQSHDLVRTVSFAGQPVPAGGPCDYGDVRRCRCGTRSWTAPSSAGSTRSDIADAVDYPYAPPAPRHLNRMIDLAARMLPDALAGRRQGGLGRTAAGRWPRARRAVRCYLEIEGAGGGEWYIPLDSPGAAGSPGAQRWRTSRWTAWSSASWRPATGSRTDLAAGQEGDRDAIHDVLYRHREHARRPVARPVLRRRRPCGCR